MDQASRAERERQDLAGYENGIDSPIVAIDLDLRQAESARAVIVVERTSYQNALETLARQRGRDLAAEGVAVLPNVGSGLARRYLRQFGPTGEGRSLAGGCNADAFELFRRALIEAGVDTPETIADMARLGFHACDRYLEVG